MLDAFRAVSFAQLVKKDVAVQTPFRGYFPETKRGERCSTRRTVKLKSRAHAISTVRSSQV